MMVGGSYMQPMFGQDVWTPTAEDRQMMGFGGHAQCVVGMMIEIWRSFPHHEQLELQMGKQWIRLGALS